jgi:potassium channel
LAENGATLQIGDVGQYACTAVEQNNLNLLQDIMRYGGDITLPNNSVGTTALHVAVSEDSVEIVKFLLEHGANIDKQDKYGWSPRDLADQQGHTEIKAIFEAKGEDNSKIQSFVSVPIPERQDSKVRWTISWK